VISDPQESTRWIRAEKRRNLGLPQIATGMSVVVVAVLVFGLTKDSSGTPDWISIVTAIAGVVVAVTGVYTVLRNRGTRPTGLRR